MHLLHGTKHKLFAIALLISPASLYSHAAADVVKCNPAISPNCGCSMPLLEAELGIEDTKFLVEIWERAYAKSVAPQDDFFRQHAERILPISLRYGLIKYFVAAKCGTLAFADGNE